MPIFNKKHQSQQVPDAPLRGPQAPGFLGGPKGVSETRQQGLEFLKDTFWGKVNAQKLGSSVGFGQNVFFWLVFLGPFYLYIHLFSRKKTFDIVSFLQSFFFSYRCAK